MSTLFLFRPVLLLIWKFLLNCDTIIKDFIYKGIIMKKKLKKLSIISFITSILIFAGSYFMYHFLTPEGFTLAWHAECGKPFVTELFANLGVLFLFTGIISLMILKIFFSEDRK